MLKYFAIISCALYLLEHASWSCKNLEPSRDVDLEAFLRWVEGGDLAKVEREIEVARRDYRRRTEMNWKLVYGSADISAKL